MKNFTNNENKDTNGVVRPLGPIDKIRLNGRLIGTILGMIVIVLITAITAYGAVAKYQDIPYDDGVTVIVLTTSSNTDSVDTMTNTLTTTVSDVKTVMGSSTTTTSKAKTEAITIAVHTYPFQVVSASINTTNTTDEIGYEECDAIDVDTYDEVEETFVENHVQVVYKPSTKYIHKSTCRWNDNSCYEITTTEDIDARKCPECNPDMAVINEYIPPVDITHTVTDNNTTELTSLNYITEAERIMLCNVVAGEYGSDCISQYDKACIVACVMNRYYDGGWQGSGMDNTIYNVITAPGQFASYYANSSYNSNVTDSCISAVEYYFENQSSFPHYTSFYGDGTRNYFE